MSLRTRHNWTARSVDSAVASELGSIPAPLSAVRRDGDGEAAGEAAGEVDTILVLTQMTRAMEWTTTKARALATVTGGRPTPANQRPELGGVV